jgi:hypothetical protein
MPTPEPKKAPTIPAGTPRDKGWDAGDHCSSPASNRSSFVVIRAYAIAKNSNAPGMVPAIAPPGPKASPVKDPNTAPSSAHDQAALNRRNCGEGVTVNALCIRTKQRR